MQGNHCRGKLMLLDHLDSICKCTLLLMLLIFACAGYAYRSNARRPDDDPKKRDFYPAAIFLAPFTWPVFLFTFICIFVLRALVYGLFLILFTIALIAIRKPFLFILLDRIATHIGNKLLEANRFLIRIVFGDWGRNSQPI